ncbi:hypothetical protein ACU4GD_01440 [Cupriavidus basilensis]
MNFALEEEHQMLKDLVARFVRGAVDPRSKRAYWPARQRAASSQLLPQEQDKLDGLSRTGPVGPGRAG